MKHITIVVPEGKKNNLSSIAGTYKILTRANDFWKASGKKDRCRIVVAGTSKKVTYFDGLFSVTPHMHISAIRKTDLIIIPSLNHDYHYAVKANAELIDWINRRQKRGTEVAAICTGAFLLASTGILNGRSCSTHWAAADQFRDMFPDVHLQPDRVLTDEHGIYTNGGAYSFLNLVLYLVEKYYDRKTAIYCSKVFQIDFDRNSQSPFTMFTGQKTHGDELVRKAQAYIENRLSDRLSIARLSQHLSVGRRSFDRRFIRATGNTPLEYAQRVRVEAAKRLFENSPKSVQEVMYDVGYSDGKSFREIFRRITGLSPMEYRNKFNRDSTANATFLSR